MSGWTDNRKRVEVHSGLAPKATVSLVFSAMARGPRKLKIVFGSASLTHYGGVYLLHRFFGRLRLKKLLTDATRLIQRNNRYSVGEMLLALLYPIILGLERIESTHLLRQNGIFQYLTGRPSYPDATLLCERNVLPPAPVGLQPRQLVQAPVSAPRVSWRHSSNVAP